MKELTEEEALVRVESYCAVSEHCLSEVRGKLEKWGLCPETIERIETKLVEDNFVSEERFCRAFVNDRFRFSKWGKRKIAQELYFKKIPSPLVQQCLDNIDDDEYQNCLKGLLASKRPGIKAKNDYELRGKLIRFALGRGFEVGDICRCLDISDEDVYSE